jgi:SAM-dependent methyltransferase
MIIIDPKEYWTKRYNEAGDNTVWLNNKYQPETHKIRKEFLKAGFPTNQMGTVLDFGCGTGAYSELFHPDLYIGYDHMEKAIEIAKRKNPKHDYTTSKTQYGYYTLFTNCVLQHNPQDVVKEILDRYAKNKCVILYECTDERIQSGHCEGRSPEWYSEVLGREVDKVYSHVIDGAEHSMMVWLQQ